MLHLSVITLKAGINYFQIITNPRTPAFAGMTTFYELVIICLSSSEVKTLLSPDCNSPKETVPI